MPSPPAIQRPHKSSITASIANGLPHNQPPSNSAFPPFPPAAPPLQFPSNSIQTNLLLNSLLLRHLQLNNQQQNAGSQQQPPQQQPSMPPQMFCPNDYFTPVQSSQPSSAAGGAAMFAKTIDSLYNFLSPNVIILPVASHSLPDEQHIQLLGMPQTIIPVALHPHMLRQFPVRPLLVEPGINGGKMSTTAAPNQLPILMANSSTTKDDRAQQFHLPISFRHSLFPSPPSSNPPFSSTGNSRQQIGPTGMAMENCSERERTPPHQQQQNCQKLIGKGEEMAVEDANSIEPLDLSMATAAAISSSSLCSNLLLNKNSQQSRKRGGQNEKKENVNEHQQMQRKRVKSTDEGEGIVLNAAAFLHPMTASVAPNGIGIIPGIVGIAAAAPSKSPTDNSRAGPLSSSTIPSKMGADETPKKRFPCDLCGDVSFLALETLEGHKKYYCRNRSRPDPMEASKANMLEHPMATKVPSSFPGNDQQNPLPPLLHCHQCAFRAQNAEQLASHERQLHPPSFICIVCGYKAFTIRGLRTHVRLSHGQQQQNLTKLLNGQKTEEKNKEGEEEVGGNDEKNLNEVKKSPLAEIKQEKIN